MMWKHSDNIIIIGYVNGYWKYGEFSFIKWKKIHTVAYTWRHRVSNVVFYVYKQVAETTPKCCKIAHSDITPLLNFMYVVKFKKNI